jgi:succinate dehydrogenase / fumarate reductase cytochrome b subunit
MKYGRNRAFTWQRLSSWVLLVGIILHVAKFRFIDYPDSVNQGENSYYFIPVAVDKGLYTVAARLGVTLYSPDEITAERKEFEDRHEEQALVDASKTFEESNTYDHQQQVILTSAQAYEQKLKWLQVLEKQKVDPTQVVAVAKDFGTASVLAVRDTFKDPLYVGLYTIFVLAACFHGFNGLWTFCITWGLVLKVAAQQRILRWAWALMIFVTFLGLAAIWGTYWLNLKA